MTDPQLTDEQPDNLTEVLTAVFRQFETKTARDGLIQRAAFYGPILPDGEQDVWPCPVSAAPAWVSVSERLPDLDVPVLARRRGNPHIWAMARDSDSGCDEGWVWVQHHMGALDRRDSYEWSDDYDVIEWAPMSPALPQQSAAALSEHWGVLDECQMLTYTAPDKRMCQEHVNDAINEHGIKEAAQWVIRPIFVGAPPLPQPEDNAAGEFVEADE